MDDSETLGGCAAHRSVRNWNAGFSDTKRIENAMSKTFEYDVLLSYSSKDKNTFRKLAEV